MPSNYPFQKRWAIEGVLTAATPLHIGSGEWKEDPTKENPREHWLLDDNGDPVKIAALARDCKKQPYIPASALKGCLRAWLEKRIDNAKAIFGEQDQGGKVEFLDARPIRTPEVEVTAQTAIDRRTRTVQHRKLFHAECVKPGAQFAVRILAQGLEEESIGVLLAALAAFNAGELALGASVADGWGGMTWTLKAVRCLADQAVALARVKSGKLGFEGLDEVKAPVLPVLTAKRRRLRLDITLQFDGAFLVNDPSRCKPKKNAPENDDRPNHAPKRDAGGQYLPASSFRGAFRSQAERIIRTLGNATTEKSALSMDDVKKLDRTARLFGASGWRAPVAVSDFRLKEGKPMAEARQEFVAIDRFTGGGAEHLKFNADYVLRPVFEGKLEIDLDALKLADIEAWGIGLLAFTMRDLREGDITFGFGAAKGYGACTATVSCSDPLLAPLFTGDVALTPEETEYLKAVQEGN